MKFLEKITAGLECDKEGNPDGAEKNLLDALKQIPDLASTTTKEDKEIMAKQLSEILSKTIPPNKGGHKASFWWFFGALTVILCGFLIPGIGPLTGVYGLGKFTQAIQGDS